MHADIQLIILAGRGAMNGHLRLWAERFDHCRVLYGADLPDHVACLRNRAVKWFRDDCPSDLRWLLMVDDDVVPVAQTEELLACPADVASAAVWARTGREAHAHTLSAACLKISRRAAESIRPPWFRFLFSADGTRLEMCECRYFWRKARQEGFSPVRAGAVGHRFPVIVLPPMAGEGQVACRDEPRGACPCPGRPAFRFDGEIDHA